MALGVVVALALGEVATRMFLPAPERARLSSGSGFAERLAAENAAPIRFELQGSVDDERAGGVLYFHTPTGMRMRANTHAVIENHRLGGLTVDIETNSLGQRNRELGQKERPRVLFIGDSITVQDYLPEEQTIVRLVEQLSEKTDEPLETVNAGVGAIGLANELAILMETGFATEPDVVVLNWYLNDAESSSGVEILEPSGVLAHSRLAELLLASVAGLEPNRIRRDVSTISPEMNRAWRAQLEADFPGRPGDYVTEPEAFNLRIQDLLFDWGSAFAAGAWERMSPIIEEMKRQVDAHGAKFVIVAFPVREQIDAEFLHDYPQQRLAELAERLDIPMLDLLPILRRDARANDGRYYWDWCHPSPLGSEIIANAILAFLQHGRAEGRTGSSGREIIENSPTLATRESARRSPFGP